MKKCIVCETELTDEIIEKHEVQFCSEKCLLEYEEKLKKMNAILDWDKCC